MANFLNGFLFISEIMADNAGSNAIDVDGDGTANRADEFVEIQNASGTAVSLDNYQLWSAANGLLYDFQPGDVIAAGGTATVIGEYTGTPPAGVYEASTNNSINFLPDGEGTLNDTIYLVDITSGEYVAIAYGSPPNPTLPTGFPGTTDVGTEQITTTVVNGTSIQRDANGDLIENTPTANASGSTGPVPDGYVAGTGDDDVIDSGYTDTDGDTVDGNDGFLPGEGPQDDIVYAGQGNDTVSSGAGNDTVYGGSGDDTISGGAGDDTIFGDTQGTTQQSESLNWIAQGINGTDLSDGFVQDTGSVLVGVTVSNDGGLTLAEASNDLQYVDGAASEPFATNSALQLGGTGNGGSGISDTTTITLDFDVKPDTQFGFGVENVQFRINDIDQGGWDDRVTVTAIGLDGQPVTVSYQIDGDETLINGGTTIDGAGSNSAGQSGGSVLVTVAGPVQSISIDYDNAGASGQALWITDVHFDTVVDEAAGNDSLSGGDGNDTIYGYGGDDVLLGGDGNDILFGGDGIDDLNGGTGDDTLDGGDGDDILTGGGGDDTLLGGDGADEFYGDAGEDTIDARDGNQGDIIEGGDDADTIYADGNDTVDGSEGGDDNDTLIVENVDRIEYDTLNSENGTVFFSDGTTLDFTNIENVTVVERDGIVSGTSAGEVINGSYTGDPDGDIVDNNDAIIAGEVGDDDIIEAGGGDDTVFAGAGDDEVFGEDGNDTLDGGTGTNTLVGGAGDDTFIGGAGADTFVGDSGQDNIDYSASGAAVSVDLQSGTLSGGDAANDTIGFGIDGVIGSDFDDTLLGFDDFDATYTNILSGGAGNDFIDGRGGDDVVDGGTGSDRIIVNNDAGDDTITGGEDVDGSDVDIINFTNSSGPIVTGANVVFGAGEDGTYTYDSGDSTGSFVEIERVEGSFLSDTFDASASSADIQMEGGLGDDILIGGLGDNIIEAGRDDDTIILNAAFGTDTIDGGSDPDGADIDTLDASNITQDVTVVLTAPETGTLTQGTNTAAFSEIESIILGSGDDTVTGSTGDDTVDLGQGADTVDGGAGDDTINLGEDSPGTPDGDQDEIIFGDGDGNDIIVGFDAPLDNGDGTFMGIDTLDVSGLTDANGNPVNVFDVTVTANTDGDAVLTFPNGESLTLQGVVPAEVNDPMALVAIGIPADGIVSGDGSDNIINGGYLGDPDGDIVDNNDAILPGEVGNDDIIEAGGGDDIITGGLGNDEMFGEDGDDEFVLSGTFGTDEITGGEGDEDNGGDTVIYADANDVTVVFDGNEQGTLTQGANSADFTEIEAITTGSGNDTIDLSGDSTGIDVFAGDGDDTITGGAGDDDLMGWFGDDTITGGAGDDRLDGDDGNDILDGGIGDDTLIGDDGNDTFTGGAGADLMFGGADADTFFGGVGDTVFGGETGTDNDTLDLTGAGPTRINYDPTDPEAGTVEFLDGTGNVTGTMTFSQIENVNHIPCFTPGTMIRTVEGLVPVEHLRIGMRVLTRDNGYQPIRWIGTRTLNSGELDQAPHLKGVTFRAGCFGDGLPERDTTVSPQHRMLVSGPKVELFFGESEVLVAAKHMLDMPGVVEADVKDSQTYIHLMFARHEIINGDGAWSESFQPGDLSLGGLDQGQRSELLELFPELTSVRGRKTYGSARMALRRYEARLLH